MALRQNYVSYIEILSKKFERFFTASGFIKCPRNKESNFNRCLQKSIEKVVNGLTEPLTELGLPSLEPLEIDSMSVGGGSNGPVQLIQNYKNVKFYGFSKISISSLQ